MKTAPNGPCPCQSARKYKKCCKPVLAGAVATTPEALMRSRYCAYAIGQVDHIQRTTHPQSPHWQPNAQTWREELLAFCAQTSFEGLDVHSSETKGSQGWVHFTAHLVQAGEPLLLEERSLFLKEENRWLYVRGV